MKNGIKLAACIGILACVALIWTGCASTTETTVDASLVAPADNASFVTGVDIACGVLKLGGNAALVLAVDANDRKTIASYISGSGHVFESFLNGSTPSADTITKALSAYYPTTAASYVTVAQLASSAWSTALPIINKYVSPKSANYIAYVNYTLNKLAKTAYEVADPYLE